MTDIVTPAIATAALKLALTRQEGKGPSVSLDKEMEAVLDKLPANINSPEELAKYMKVVGNVSVKKIDLIGLYSGKRINYKEK